ncbi:HesB/YadR/YfhF family protein [Paenibacillus yanchengensis]|uniref:HesB/YadR/YfhF family protein n=1 Tax=Paenibacillus yanchengensis TaxID=2035833 RepID=A0ABW4YJA9_9BACL
MKLTVTDAAVQCFLKEWSIEQGDHVRIFVRYSGGGEDAFALGIMKDDPEQIALEYVAGGIHFFIADNDAWFLDGQNLLIDSEQNEIKLLRN